MRQNFKVLRAGVATDGTFFAGKPIEFTFDPEKADLVVGEIFSAEVTESEINVRTIYKEERGQFESAETIWGLGPGEADGGRARGWRPKGTPGTGLNGGRPDSGRFSRGGPEHAK